MPAVADEDLSLALASLTVQEAAVALSMSAAMVALATLVEALLPFALGSIPVVTFMVLGSATMFSRFFERYKAAAAGVGVLFMQIFFVATGCEGNARSVMAKAPMMFGLSCVQLGVHLVTFLAVRKVLRFRKAEMLISSIANVAEPTTAAGIAAAKDWYRQILPAVLIRVLGYSVATFVPLVLGHIMLKPR